MSWTFTTGKRPDITPPTITAVLPVASAPNVAVNATIAVTFSEPINPATVTSSSFGVVDNNGAAVAGEFSFSGVTATFTPGTITAPVNLKNSSNYNVNITNAIADLSGNHLTLPKGWEFKTEAPHYSLTVSSGANGSLTVYDKAGEIDPVVPQLTKLTLSGVNVLNSDSGKLYWNLVKVGGDYSVILFKDSTGTSSVAKGSITTANGSVTLLAEKGSGISGSVNIAYTADDLTTGANILTVESVPAGTVNLVITIPNNSSREITITPISGYDLRIFTNGGLPVTDLVRLQGLSYYLTSITSDKTIGATFVANATPPVIAATAPANLATGIAQSAVISATFSKSMDPATITDSTFIVKDPGGNAILGTVSYSGLVATFTPTLPLNIPTQLYTATILQTATK